MVADVGCTHKHLRRLSGTTLADISVLLWASAEVSDWIKKNNDDDNNKEITVFPVQRGGWKNAAPAISLDIIRGGRKGYPRRALKTSKNNFGRVLENMIK